jgi:hypothetical protein
MVVRKDANKQGDIPGRHARFERLGGICSSQTGMVARKAASKQGDIPGRHTRPSLVDSLPDSHSACRRFRI